MTIVIEEPRPGIDQAKKQLEKLVPVVSVRELDGDAVQRELVLVKVNGEEPDKVNAITDMYNGETMNAGPETITVQLTGGEQKIDDALEAYEQFGIREIVRTGYAALARGVDPTARVAAPNKMPDDAGTQTQETADD